MRAALAQATATDRVNCGHVDVGKSGIERDFKDFQKMKSFLLMYSPFRFVDNDRLISLCSGITAGVEDAVNCDQADVIGLQIQQKWDGCLYGEITCKKADQIKPMAHLMTACSIGNETVVVDPIHLFHRLIIVGERESNLRQCFEFEMTPYPMSLFKNGVMRKPEKPSLYSEFTTGLQASKPAVSQFVVDGDTCCTR